MNKNMRKTLITIFFLALAAVPLSAKTLPKVFADPLLQNLITEALEANSDLRTAQLAVEQSEALLKNARLAYLPSFSLAPSATFSQAQGQRASWTYELPVKMGWEFNLGGKQHFQKEMANFQRLQNQAQLKAMQVLLVAEVANAYYTLIMLDRQLEISRQALQNQQENVEVFMALKEVGQQTVAAVNQAEASCHGVAASIPMLESQIRQAETALCRLLNRQAGEVERATWETVGGIALEDIDNVPLECLASRPDVLAAEYGLRAAGSHVDVARADFYPTFSISGSAGWTNDKGITINPMELLLNAIGSLVQPIFAQGSLKANLKVAQSQQQQAQIAFEKALLVAGGEVRDALALRDACVQRETARSLQVEASRKAYENSRELMRHSSNVTYLEVLTAQSALLEAQLQQTADWLEKQQSMIGVYKATCLEK